MTSDKITEADLDYLRNIDARPGPNAGGAIDKSLPPYETTPASADHPLHGLYEFLLREFEAIPTSGEAVTADVRPHFNALCEYMAADSTPASADVIEGMREALGRQDLRERFARALYFAAEGLSPESWYLPENDAHWERWRDDGDEMSPSPLAVADALIAAFPALALPDSKPDKEGA